MYGTYKFCTRPPLMELLTLFEPLNSLGTGFTLTTAYY